MAKSGRLESQRDFLKLLWLDWLRLPQLGKELERVMGIEPT